MALPLTLLLLNFSYLIASAFVYDFAEDRDPTCPWHRVLRSVNRYLPAKEGMAND